MPVDKETVVNRIDELERRMAALERRLVTRDVLDDEIRSLEHRLSEVRELTEG
jgi:hypothetical protein